MARSGRIALIIVLSMMGLVIWTTPGLPRPGAKSGFYIFLLKGTRTRGGVGRGGFGLLAGSERSDSSRNSGTDLRNYYAQKAPFSVQNATPLIPGYPLIPRGYGEIWPSG